MDELVQAKLHSWEMGLPTLGAAQLWDGDRSRSVVLDCICSVLQKFWVRPVSVKIIWLRSSAQCSWF